MSSEPRYFKFLVRFVLASLVPRSGYIGKFVMFQLKLPCLMSTFDKHTLQDHLKILKALKLFL